MTPTSSPCSQAMNHLFQCYECLRDDPREAPKGKLLKEAVAFHHLLVTLHGVKPEVWELRPKHHMLLELALEDSGPASTWTYRDESYGGSVAHQTHRRGGEASALACSRAALTLFMAREPFPRLA